MRFIVISLVSLSACTQFPELEGTISDAARDAPYPTLTEIPFAPPSMGAEQDELQARVTALQTRAASIRQIDISALQ